LLDGTVVAGAQRFGDTDALLGIQGLDTADAEQLFAYIVLMLTHFLHGNHHIQRHKRLLSHKVNRSGKKSQEKNIMGLFILVILNR
jgi:hypothetical protein